VEVSSKYYRISVEKDLFYTVRELIALLDYEHVSEKEAVKVTDQLIESMSTFLRDCFVNDKHRPHRQKLEPIIAELQNKLINQKANSDANIAGTEFYDILICLSDCLNHIINGGSFEELNTLFPLRVHEPRNIDDTLNDNSNYGGHESPITIHHNTGDHHPRPNDHKSTDSDEKSSDKKPGDDSNEAPKTDPSEDPKTNDMSDDKSGDASSDDEKGKGKKGKGKKGKLSSLANKLHFNTKKDNAGKKKKDTSKDDDD